MATGGEKHESSGPGITSVAGDDNHDDDHNGNVDKDDQNKEKTTTSSSLESSWGEPVESTARVNNSKSSPTAEVRSASEGAIDGSPPVGQPIDRVEDPEAYRIPSEVFSRTKSSAQMEWSVASNESLFSIQMGNMSFTKDNAFLLGKSEELGYDPMASPMRDRPPISSSPETTSPYVVIAKDNKSGGGGGNQHNPTRVAKEASFHSASLRRSSTASGASVKSFAFPILTGDGQHRSTQSQSQPPTPQTAQQDPLTPRSSDRDDVNNNNSKPSTPKSGENKGTSGGQFRKWFSCFPCCASRVS